MKNILLPFIFTFSIFLAAPSIAQLNPGDIMIVGFMGDGDGTPIPTPSDPPSANCGDGFSFVCLVNIADGEEVIFTEEEWTPSAFNNEDEGHVIWTNNTGSSIPAATVIQVTTHGQAEVVAGNCGTLTSTMGSVSFGDDGSGTDNWALSSSNEEIYVYQGTPGNPTNWISAFFTDDFNVNSFVPAVLNGFVVDLESVDSDADVAVYSGSLDCSVPGSCLASITDPANWSTDNGPGFQCCDGTGAEYPDDVPVVFEGFCQPPVITCPADVTVECGESTDQAATGTATASDGCGAVIITFSDSFTAGCSNTGTIMRTWIAEDENGDTDICTQTITIVDTTPPVAPEPPEDVSVSCTDDIPPPVNLTASDICNGDIAVSPTEQITPGICDNDFIMVRTWTFADECGNSSSISQTITVKDEIAPVAPEAPADLTLECAKDIPPPVSLTATDNCGGEITVSPTGVVITGDCANDFTLMRTWTFNDECGNSSSVIQTIKVKDEIAPIAPQPPADLTLECAEDVPPPVPLTATNNCRGDITVNPTAIVITGNCTNDFVMVRTWTFRDECGNTSSVSQTITVRDDNPPIAPVAPADLTLECADDVPPPVDLTATDNCGGPITVSPTSEVTPGACANDFIMVRTWTFTDDCGNTSSVSQTITVRDDLAPVAPTPPADLTLECADDVPPPINLTAENNCGDPITVGPTAQITPGSCANDFTMIRTWTFTDLCGNSSSVSQTITVLDDTAPVAPAAPADLTLQCTEDVPPPVDLTATDNCGGPITVSPTSQVTPGACANDFIMVRTWSFTDDCGNSSSVSQTITVKDETAPVAQAPADLTLECAEDVPPPMDLTATDNCNGDITVSPTSQVTPGACANDFIMVRTWTFIDDCGNTSSVSQTITVRDDNPPIAPVAPADLTLECADDVPPPVDLTATDNCAGLITVSPTSQVTQGSCANDFILVRTWTFTDDCGNTSSISQTITVLDTTPPVITGTSGELQILETDPGVCGAVVEYSFIDVNDNCSSSVDLNFAPDIGTFLPVGVTEISVTATDECGNTSIEIFEIKVVDVEDPVLSCPADITVNNDPDFCGAVVTYLAPTGTDNCPGVTTLLSDGLGSGAFFPIGTTTETYTSIDVEGNTTSCSFLVTVIDVESPVITVAQDPLILWPPNHKYYTINVADFVIDIDDECSSLSISDIYVSNVTSDEPEDVNGGGDGNTINDIVISQDCQSVDLRVERQGKGNGRVYTVMVAVTDESGNTGTAEYQVHVPKSNSKGATDDGAAYGVNGCRNENARFASSTPIQESGTLLEEVVIYPNPVVDIVTIKLPDELMDGSEVIEVHLYNLNGTDVSNRNHQFVNSNILEIDMKELPAGVYLLVIPNDGDFFRYKINKL